MILKYQVTYISNVARQTVLSNCGWLTNSHLPDSDNIIRVSSKQSLTVSRPGHRQALRRISLAVLGVLRDDFILELINHGLAFKIPDLDGRSGSGAKPVSVGGEAQGIDDVGVIQSVQPLVVVQVPQHGLAVLATGGTQGTVRRDGDSVQVTSVVIVILLKSAVGQVPDLHHTIPATWYNDGVVVVGGESDTGYPVSVTFLL